MNLEKFRELSWADFFLYSLLDPRALYRRIKQKDPDSFLMSFIVPAAVALSDILVISLLGKQSGFFYYKISYGWILVFLYTILKVIVYASMMDMVAQFFGHKGNIRELIILVNFAMLPELFLLPALYPFIVMNFVASFFYVLFSIIFFIWHVLILIQGISEMHTIDFGKSFVIFILPAVITGIILFLIFIMLVITLFGYIAGL